MPADLAEPLAAPVTPVTPVPRSLVSRYRLALALMFASGLAGLGYQIVWTQQAAVWLGHETAAVFAVVAAFFGGLALGAAALGARIERSGRPDRWYAACEATIAVWCVALTFLMAPLGGWLLAFTGAQPSAAWQWTVAFCGTFVLLLPATAAMGATLPAMARVSAQLRRDGHSIAALYASNTCGAVAGVLAGAFWLVPEFGLARTAGVCAAINLLCAAAAFNLAGADTMRALKPSARAVKLPWLLAATGLLGIGFEVLVVRVLSQVAEDTVFTFGLLLAVYLAGSALGAAFYQRRMAAVKDADRARDLLLGLLAAACLIGTLALWGAAALKEGLLHVAGAGMGSALGAEALLALAAFGLPTLVMGALFSHLATQAQTSGIGFGRALAFNTLGAAAAPLLFGVLLAPAVGPKFALLLIAAGYVALISPRGWRRPATWAPATLALALAAWAPPLAFVEVPEGGRLVSYRDGAMAAVSVVEDADGVMRLFINNRQQEGSSGTGVADARQALLPLLLHPAPRRALFLGLGTGVTALSATADPNVQVDAVELLPEVIEASARFTAAMGDGVAPARLTTIAADARRYVRASSAQYDLIVSDNFHPARSGSGALTTVEHFRAVRNRLAADGVFCQWLPLHQLDLDTLRSIVQAFRVAFPGGWAMLATNSLDTPVVGLVGRADTRRFDVGQVRARIAGATWLRRPNAQGLGDEFALLGSFIAGPESLARFAGANEANSDDRPLVAYRAPRLTYAPDSRPRDRLVDLLRELAIAPGDLLEAPLDQALQKRFAAYWTARTRYIGIGRDAQPSGDVRRMLAQVGDPLLSVLRTSPDFRPAYDPLLLMAQALGRFDPGAARALLGELSAMQPAWPEAAEALRRLQDSPR